MLDGLCPQCGRVGRWASSEFSTSFPPTGGDYDWMETDGKVNCPYCNATINARIRVDLDDGRVDKIIHSPFPTLTGWQYYVVAEVVRWAEDDIKVEVMRFAETLTEAREALTQKYDGGYDVGYRRRVVLKMNAAGYEELDGRPLHESAHQRIDYA